MNDNNFVNPSYIDLCTADEKELKKLLFLLEMQMLKQTYLEKEKPNYSIFIQEADKKLPDLLALLD